MRSWLTLAAVALWVCQVVPGAISVPGTDEYAAVDAHALAAPAQVTHSVAALAAYLTEPARSDRESARAIFRWITQNVSYDASAAASDPEAVLSRRRTVCAGYAALFDALAREAGLRSDVIIGNSKFFKPGEAKHPESWLNHAWNAVQIDGRWRLVDCCWGAGHCDESGRFVRSFTPHYFLTPPEAFVYDHFPSDGRWQLLDPPITRDEYLRRVQLRPTFFDCGLRLLGQRSSRIEAGGSLELVIGAPRKTYVRALLYRGGQPMEGSYTFAQRCAEGYLVNASFPSEGAYTLRLFARRGDAAGGNYTWALDYAVKARSARQDKDGFPEAFAPFAANDCRVERPFSRTLPAGKPVEFSLTASNAEQVAVVSGGSWKQLPPQGQRFSGEVPVSRGDVIVVARFAGQQNYESLLRYTAEYKASPAEQRVCESAAAPPAPVVRPSKPALRPSKPVARPTQPTWRDLVERSIRPAITPQRVVFRRHRAAPAAPDRRPCGAYAIIAQRPVFRCYPFPGFYDDSSSPVEQYTSLLGWVSLPVPHEEAERQPAPGRSPSNRGLPPWLPLLV